MIRPLAITCLLVGALPAAAQDTSFLNAARDAYAAAWKVSPLSLENAVFVTRPADLIGDIAAREDALFAPGEAIRIYAQPLGYGYLETENGVEFGVDLDLELLSEAGKLLVEQEGFQSIRLASSVEVREMYLNIEIDLDGLGPGAYQLRIRANDIASDETAETTLPFEVDD